MFSAGSFLCLVSDLMAIFFSKHLNFRCFCWFFLLEERNVERHSFNAGKNIFTTFWKGTAVKLQVGNQILPENNVQPSTQLKITINPLPFFFSPFCTRESLFKCFVSEISKLTTYFSHRRGLLIVMVNDSVSCIYSSVFKKYLSHHQFIPHLSLSYTFL